MAGRPSPEWFTTVVNDGQETEQSMKIWVDADACPKVIKEILFRVAQRKQVELILVAN